MNEGIHLDLDTWIVPGQIRKANLCRGLGNRYTPAGSNYSMYRNMCFIVLVVQSNFGCDPARAHLVCSPAALQEVEKEEVVHVGLRVMDGSEPKSAPDSSAGRALVGDGGLSWRMKALARAKAQVGAALRHPQ